MGWMSLWKSLRLASPSEHCLHEDFAFTLIQGQDFYLKIKGFRPFAFAFATSLLSPFLALQFSLNTSFSIRD